MAKVPVEEAVRASVARLGRLPGKQDARTFVLEALETAAAVLFGTEAEDILDRAIAAARQMPTRE